MSRTTDEGLAVEGLAVATLELPVSDGPPEFAVAEAAAIAEGWAARVAANPALWNGSFFLFEDVAITPGGSFRAVARPTDFAAFLHWGERVAARDGRWAHVFPVAAVTTRDDRLLVGVQSGSSVHAARAYPPSGSFDGDDRIGDRLDPLVNIRRELEEEVGIDLDTLEATPGWTVIGSGPHRFALVKRHTIALSSAELAERIAAHLAVDPQGELSRVRLLGFEERLAPGETVPYVNRLLTLLDEGRRSPPGQGRPGHL